MDAKALEREIKKELKLIARMAKNRMLTPTQTWNNPPDFVISGPMLAGDDLVCRVRTLGSSQGDMEFFFLDEGTKTRFATMTRDFMPKTAPRSFKASPGKGGLLFVNRKRPRPGIEARKWTTLTALEYSAVLQSAIDKKLAGYKGKPTTYARAGRVYVP